MDSLIFRIPNRMSIDFYTAMADFGTAMINWKASHKKLKGYKKQLKK